MPWIPVRPRKPKTKSNLLLKKDIEIISDEEIEEVAKKIYPHNNKGLTIVASNKIMLRRAAFVKGAKLMQEQLNLRK